MSKVSCPLGASVLNRGSQEVQSDVPQNARHSDSPSFQVDPADVGIVHEFEALDADIVQRECPQRRLHAVDFRRVTSIFGHLHRYCLGSSDVPLGRVQRSMQAIGSRSDVCVWLPAHGDSRRDVRAADDRQASSGSPNDTPLWT